MKSAIKRRGGQALLAALGGLLASCAGAGGPGYAPAPALGSPMTVSKAGDAAKSKRVALPENRPGLATGFGERMASSMAYTDFHRSSTKPIAFSSLRYNDSEGATAMGLNRSSRKSGLQRVPGDFVEWGVKSRRKILPSYLARGGRFVIGNKGSNYSLLVKNRSKSRLEAVMSVDGLDVIDGKTASTKKRGYLVYPGKTLEVKGFRTSHQAVAAFKFSSVGNSYANLRHGETRNVGVLGLAVYSEKGIDPWFPNWQEAQRRGGAQAFAEEPIYRARTVVTD
ncbi:hypothetical protein N9868_02045 [Akkermansiaceae bacterium]|nr:hypothetical protein [Akkermansiaceae bacterium]MDB4382064.1 hypothetical protein [Akkermansiaceae bacterium]